MPPSPREILERRLRAEALRRGEPVETVRDAMLLRGLDAAQRDRAALAAAADVVLVTATPTEHLELEQAARVLGADFQKQSGRYGPYFSLGIVGGNRVVAIQVSMGAFGPNGAAARCIQARAETGATTIVLLGTAFGVDPERQRPGHVIVSESVFLYDDRRAIEPRLGQPRPYVIEFPPSARRFASKAWLSRCERLAEVYARTADPDTIEVGVVLSGGARIESAAFRDELVRGLPAMGVPIVGGEMEGMGAVSAALDTDPEDPGWLIVKGISDFADAESRARISDTRARAARASAMAVLRVLQLPPKERVIDDAHGL